MEGACVLLVSLAMFCLARPPRSPDSLQGNNDNNNSSREQQRSEESSTLLAAAATQLPVVEEGEADADEDEDAPL